jgi:5-dehydro-2-deoxygluconokinase
LQSLRDNWDAEAMPLGYDRKLYVLAFDHRGSFTKRFGIEGELTAEQIERIADGKHLIFEGLQAALGRGADPSATGALVDEQYGSPAQIPELAKAAGIRLAMPVEKSGQQEFDFEYGEDFGAHIERFDPDFSKVLVRYNPDGDAEMNRRQTERLRRLSDWLHDHDRKYLFELLVPAEEAQLAAVGGDPNRYDAELRPELMRTAIAALQDAGVEPDVWKIEGVDQRADCERIAAQCREGGRDGVACVVLGRGADNDKVDHWLREAAPVDGYVGFAIGRSIWGDPLAGFIAGDLAREDAAAQVADNYLRFIEVYTSAEAPVG